MIGQYMASASPGNEQRMRWGSASAAQEASFNLAGAASPAIDGLIAALLAAQSDDDFITAVRAYDRVLLSGFYVVPLFHASEQWIAHSSDDRAPAASAALWRADVRADARKLVEEKSMTAHAALSRSRERPARASADALRLRRARRRRRAAAPGPAIFHDAHEARRMSSLTPISTAASRRASRNCGNAVFRAATGSSSAPRPARRASCC